MLRPRLLSLPCLFLALLSAAAAERPNVLFLAIDDLRGDLGAFGVAHAQTPHLDAFARTARGFTRHYVQVPTCGASRAALLRGRHPTRPVHLGNNAIRDTQAEWGRESLPAWFRQHGYRTLALGKISHYPGGRSGRDWAEGAEELPGAWDRIWIPDSPWRHAQAMMHGYANGRPRQSGVSPPLESFDGPDTAYPDGWVARDAVATLRDLARAEQPWFFAVGFFKPHLPFAAPRRYFDQHDPATIAAPRNVRRPEPPSGWHGSGEFRGHYGHGGRDPESDPAYARELRHAYAAAISYVDAQVGQVLAALEQLQLDRRTIVVVWSDHGFLLGEHGIWGKHCLYEEALRSPLLIRRPGMPQPGRTTTALAETVDVFPTLTALAGLPSPPGLTGRSLVPQLENPSVPAAKPARAAWPGRRTVRTERWRLIVHAPEQPGGEPGLELFDFERDPDEAHNVAAAHPQVVAELMPQLPPFIPAPAPRAQP